MKQPQLPPEFSRFAIVAFLLTMCVAGALNAQGIAKSILLVAMFFLAVDAFLSLMQLNVPDFMKPQHTKEQKESRDEEAQRVADDPDITLYISIFRGVYKVTSWKGWLVALGLQVVWALVIGGLIFIILQIVSGA